MDSITIDGMEEMEFRHSIETMLRHGRADDAADKLKRLLNGYAGDGRLLPERFLNVSSSDVRVEGWEQLRERLGEYDRPEMAMSAISIDILDPQGVGVRPDAQGRLKPVIETSYFSDSAYPFSEAGREDLLDGYSSFGCEWQGNFENIDTTISVEGIDDLYGATVALENRVASGASAGIEDIRAGSVGSCYLAVLIHQAIRDTAREKGLPRPLCVLAGSNDAYPFFDAPAMTVDEYRQDDSFAPAQDDAAIARFDGEFEDDTAEGARAGGMASLESLIGLGAKKREKKPVLMIDPSEADTVETLEMPLPALGEGHERRHIMPTLDLGAGPPPQWPAEPDEWALDQPLAPVDFAGEGVAEASGPEVQKPAPAGFEPHEPLPSIDFGAFEPPAPADSAPPIDFTSGELQLPRQWEEQEPPAPIDFAAYGPRAPVDPGADEPAAPLERLPSEPPIADSASPVPREPPTAPGPGWDELDDWPAPGGRDGGTDRPGFADTPPAADVPPAGPADRLGFEDGGDGVGPFDIDRFTYPEEPAPEQWALAYDLPTGNETGDNLPWPDSGPDSHGEPRIEAARPARHAIRVIAASVTNEGNTRPGRPAAGDGSRIARWMMWIASALGWLLRRTTGR